MLKHKAYELLVQPILSVVGFLFVAVLVNTLVIDNANATASYIGFTNANVSHVAITGGPNYGAHKELQIHAGVSNSIPNITFYRWYDGYDHKGPRIEFTEFIDGVGTHKRSVTTNLQTARRNFTYLDFEVYKVERKKVHSGFSADDAESNGVIHTKDDAINNIGNKVVRYRIRTYEISTTNTISEANITISRKHVGIEWVSNTDNQHIELNSGDYVSGTTNYPYIAANAFTSIAKGAFTGPSKVSNFVIRGTEKLNTETEKSNDWVRVDQDKAWYIGRNNFEFGYWKINHHDYDSSDRSRCRNSDYATYINCFAIVFYPDKNAIDNLQGTVQIKLEIAHDVTGENFFRRITFTINGSSATFPEVSLMVSETSIIEGTDGTLNTSQVVTVNLSEPANRDISVDYSLTGVEAKIPYDVRLGATAPGRISDSVGKLTLVEGESSTEIPLEIIADNNDELDETFKITLTGSNYSTVSTLLGSRTITITDDDDPPTVSIATTVFINETDTNSTGMITLSLDRASGKTVNVPFTVQTGSAVAADFTLVAGAVDFVPDSVTKITNTSMNIRYTIIGDEVSEPSEQFTITLAAPTNGTLSEENYIGTVIIRDDETPELTVISGDHVVEAENATADFVISAQISPNRNITIKYNLTESHNFIKTDFIKNDGKNMLANLDFTEGTTESTLSIPIDNDSTDESNGTIRVTLQPENMEPFSYRLSTNQQNFGEIQVIDDDGSPHVFITTNATNITEGDSFDFMLTVLPIQNTPLTITLTEDDSNSEYFGSYSLTTFEIPTSGSLIVTVSTNLKATHDPDATLNISIVSHSSYQISPNNGSISINIENYNLPTISISSSAHDNAIVEGSNFSFTLEADPAPAGDLLVNLIAESNPDGYLAENFNLTIVVRTSGKVDVTVATNTLSDVQDVGQIIIGIAENPGFYLISAEKTSISVTISKVQAPELSRISITSNANGVSIVEGREFEFQLLAEPAPTTNLEVNLAITDAGFFDPTQITSVSIPSSGHIKNTVMTRKILASAESGEIEISIEGSSNYYISASENLISFMVLDEEIDSTPVASINPVTNRIIMREEASFDIRLNPVPTNPVTVNLIVSYEGTTLLWRAPRRMKLQGRYILTLPTLVDWENINTPHHVRVQIAPGDGYEVSEIGENVARVFVDGIENASQTGNLTNISVASSVANSILAVMTGGNQPESSSPSLTDSGSTKLNIEPTIAVSAVESQIQEGEFAKFLITARNNSDSSSIIVKLSINPIGDFFDFSEPKLITRRILGHGSVHLVFPTIDDNLAEADGLLEVLIIPDVSYKIASNKGSTAVIVSDAVDRQLRQDLLTFNSQAFLPDIFGNMTVRTTDLISQRVQQGFSESNNVSLNLGGQNTLPGLIEMSGEMTNQSLVSWRELLGDSSFALTLLSGEDFVAPTTIWGVGDYRDLSSSSSSNSWSGDVFTGQFGIDTLIGNEILTGLSASISENEIEMKNKNVKGLEFALNSTALTPYFGWTSPTQDAEIRAIAGYGVGEFTIDQAKYDIETLASRSYSFALSGRKELYSSNSLFNGTTKLNIIGDSWFARNYIDGHADVLANLQIDTHYLRLRTEGTHQFSFTRGSALTPLMSVGIRDDRKEQLSNFSIELSGGIDYTDPIGLNLSGFGSMLYAGENTIQKMSVNGTLGYDYGKDALGLTFAISPTWGQTLASVQNTLWSSSIVASGKEVGQYSDGTQVSSELGYGFALGDDISKLNLYSGYEFDASSDDELLFGTSISIGSSIGFDLERTNKIGTPDSEITKYQINGRISW